MTVHDIRRPGATEHTRVGDQTIRHRRAFRYVVEAGNGGSWAFRGSYHSVQDGTIVHTWEYEAEPGVTLETLQFADLPDGRSVLEINSTYTSKKACDDLLASGINAGMDEDFERLDVVAAEFSSHSRH